MIKVSMFYTGRTAAVNGASKVVSCFNKHSCFFEKQGIDFGGVFELGSGSNSESTAQKSKNSKIKKCIIGFLNSSTIGNLATVKKFWFGNANKVVNKYIGSGRKDDVLVFHDFFSCNAYIDKISGECGTKLILVLHNDGDVWKMFLDSNPKLKNTPFERCLNKLSAKVLNRIDALVFVSDASRNNFCRLNPEYRNKARTVHNGIEARAMQNKCGDDRLELVTVGSVCERKRQTVLIKALARSGVDNANLTIVGNGQEFDACVQLIKQNKLEHRVKMPGSRSDVAEILDKCNCFVLVSSSEGLPIAGIEALRSGLAMILTDVGGNSELIADNGMLISTDEEDIVSAIRKMDSDRVRLHELGAASRKLFEERYSVDSMLKGYCDLIKEICDGKEI